MELLPVIDVRHGVAVQAVRGRRELYLPLESPLSPDSDPVNVAKGYCAFASFGAIYVADLDGIEGRGANLDLLARLASALPGLAIWLDAGISRWEDAQAVFAHPAAQLVLGSESQSDASLLTRCRRTHAERVVLSLDFRGEGFIGPAALLKDPACWPDRVIAMTLGKVGSGEGPDLARVKALAAARPDCFVYAAGGVRCADDLLQAREAGAAGALIATALHRGGLNRQDVSRCLLL